MHGGNTSLAEHRALFDYVCHTPCDQLVAIGCMCNRVLEWMKLLHTCCCTIKKHSFMLQIAKCAQHTSKAWQRTRKWNIKRVQLLPPRSNCVQLNIQPHQAHCWVPISPQLFVGSLTRHIAVNKGSEVQVGCCPRAGVVGCLVESCLLLDHWCLHHCSLAGVPAGWGVVWVAAPLVLIIIRAVRGLRLLHSGNCRG